MAWCSLTAGAQGCGVQFVILPLKYGFTPLLMSKLPKEPGLSGDLLQFHLPAFNPISQQQTKIPGFTLVSVQG